MNVVMMIICATIVLGVLVFIHEGGHYLAARAFGVRVTEFMLGMPGPRISFKRGETRFGVTCVPLGGYAKVCGMEGGEIKPHIEQVLASIYRRGTATMEEVAADCGITDDEAYEALEELVEWGSVEPPTKADKFNTYRTPEVKPTKRQIRKALKRHLPAPQSTELGSPRVVENAHELYESEYSQQYRSKPFWKRSIILLAGITVNLLFAIAVFIFIYSVIGFDIQMPDSGEIVHRTLAPLQSIQMGFYYIAAVFQAILGLFNPATAAQTVSESTSIIGIAVLSQQWFAAGVIPALEFTAMISVSLGLMNLLPIPPLDGGRFVVEIFQKITSKVVSTRAMSYMSVAGMILFVGFFIVMLNQDIQRILTGFWS